MTSNTFPKNKIKKAYPLILPHYEKKNMNSIYPPKKAIITKQCFTSRVFCVL